MGEAEGWNRDLEIVLLESLGHWVIRDEEATSVAAKKGLFRQILDEETWRVRFWVGGSGRNAVPVTFFRNFGVQGTRFLVPTRGELYPCGTGSRRIMRRMQPHGLEHKALSCRVESCSTARTHGGEAVVKARDLAHGLLGCSTRDFQQLPGHTTTLPLTDRRMLDQTAGAEIIEGFVANGMTRDRVVCVGLERHRGRKQDLLHRTLNA